MMLDIFICFKYTIRFSSRKSGTTAGVEKQYSQCIWWYNR